MLDLVQPQLVQYFALIYNPSKINRQLHASLWVLINKALDGIIFLWGSVKQFLISVSKEMRGNIRKYLFTFISEISGDRGSD